MKISISHDGMVGVDGVFRAVDVSDLNRTIHAIHFDTVANKGRIWFKAETDKGQADLTNISAYQIYLDRWTVAAPPPPVQQPPKDLLDWFNELIMCAEICLTARLSLIRKRLNGPAGRKNMSSALALP